MRVLREAMSVQRLSVGRGVAVAGRGLGARPGAVCLLLTAVAILGTGCRSPSAVTGQWVPPYVQMYLCEGKAEVQWQGASVWTELQDEASIVVEESGRIAADAAQGARLCWSDGSTLDLAPATVVEVRDPQTHPRLQVVLEGGSLLLVAQKPSYEVILPACSVTLLGVPSRIRVEVSDEMSGVIVEEGTVTCVLETGLLTLFTCQELHARSGEQPIVTEFCVTAPASTPTRITTPTPFMSGPTSTPRLFATAVPTATLPPPTETPEPPPASRPHPTSPPPPTNTPVPPTQPPPPTNTPRPTPRPEPTAEPTSEPTSESTSVPPPPEETPKVGAL